MEIKPWRSSFWPNITNHTTGATHQIPSKRRTCHSRVLSAHHGRPRLDSDETPGHQKNMLTRGTAFPVYAYICADVCVCACVPLCEPAK